MLNHARKMADHANTLLQCSLKIRHGRKWKTRWCELTKLSPVSDRIVLKFYKGQDQVLSGKDIRREQIAITAENFCGLESCVRHPKNPFVLTVVCIDRIILLSFACHADLLDWFLKTCNTLASATTFKCKVSIPNGGRLRAGPGLLYLHDSHFALTDEVPSQLIGGWSLANLTRYGLIDEGFGFEARPGKNGGVFVVLTDHAETLKFHFDTATFTHLNRWSHVSSTVSIHEEVIPRRRAFSEEMRNLLHRDNNPHDDDGDEPSNANLSGRTTMTSLEQSTNHMNSFSITNRNQRLLQHRHDDAETVGARCNVEMIEMEHGWLSAGGGGASSSGSSVETIFNNCDGLRSPKKNTPIREQNYEIMASFNHLRDAMDTCNGNDEAGMMQMTHETCSICHGHTGGDPSKDNDEKNEYVNLPPRLEQNDTKPTQQDATGSIVNQDLPSELGELPGPDRPVWIDESLKRDCPSPTERRQATLASDAMHTRTMSLPLNENDFLLTNYNQDRDIPTVTTAGSKVTGKPRSLSMHPSMERSDSLPRPFNDLLSAVVLKGRLQELSERMPPMPPQPTQPDIPVPFHHGDLVRPVGPIAMLRLPSMSSSGGSSESIGSSGDPLPETKIQRRVSFSRPRQSSIGASFQKSFFKKQARSQDEGSASADCPLQSLPSSDPDFQTADDPEATFYVRKGSVERRPESPISSAPSVTSYINRRRQSLQRAEGSIDESPTRSLDDKAINSAIRRKRCNTDPSLLLDDNMTWGRDLKPQPENKEEDDDATGYLIMKPVFEEKLKRLQSLKHSGTVVLSPQGVPQSPIHCRGNYIQTGKLKRSATVGAEVSTLSMSRHPANQRTMSLRECPVTSPMRTDAPPSEPKSSSGFMERLMRRHKHNYDKIEVAAKRASRLKSLPAKNLDRNDGHLAEVDILQDRDFTMSLTEFMKKNSQPASAPSSLQYNPIEGAGTGYPMTEDAATEESVLDKERRCSSISGDYINL